MQRREHWDRVYTRRGEQDVSWFEALPSVSIAMLEAAGLVRHSCVLDVGGGDSRLVDHLAARGLDCLAVLDVSAASLRRARARLGALGDVPLWIEADVTGEWSWRPVDIWHDRAVFHFLTEPADRAGYVTRLREVLRIGGAAIVATFAPEGPERCSGLPVVRYSPDSLGAALGAGFTLVESRRHLHVTPAGVQQPFQYSRFLRVS